VKRGFSTRRADTVFIFRFFQAIFGGRKNILLKSAASRQHGALSITNDFTDGSLG
jgi:hypothetical protein